MEAGERNTATIRIRTWLNQLRIAVQEKQRKRPNNECQRRRIKSNPWKGRKCESSILNLIDPLRAVTAYNMNECDYFAFYDTSSLSYYDWTGDNPYNNNSMGTLKQTPKKRPIRNQTITCFLLAPEKHQAGRREFDTEFYRERWKCRDSGIHGTVLEREPFWKNGRRFLVSTLYGVFRHELTQTRVDQSVHRAAVAGIQFDINICPMSPYWIECQWLQT